MKLSAEFRAMIIAVAIPFGSIALSAPAAAEQFVLSQRHTQAQVYSACDAVGGVKLSGQGGGGYGCYNPSNGNMVACSSNGVCTGYTQGRVQQQRRSLGLLGDAVRGAILAPDPFNQLEPARQATSPGTNSRQ